MSHKGQRRRVRVITDKAKYRRHQRRKLFAKLLKVTAWAVIVIVGVFIIWSMLDMLFKPRPMDD
jgi:hypothetical protein